jgi:hypothetical protein
MSKPNAPALNAIDQSTEAVVVRNTIKGSTINILINGNQFTSFYPANDYATWVPLPSLLSPGDKVIATQQLGGISPNSNEVNVENNYVMYHYDKARTGWNPYERALTVNNLVNFGKLFDHTLDGYVYAQPLYVQNVSIVDDGLHNVVFVATEENLVYAFDADDNSGVNLQPLWLVNLNLNGEVPMDYKDIPSGPGGPSGDCVDIHPHIGITSTPVIDRTVNTMYIVAKTKTKENPPRFIQRLHAIEITSGAVLKSVEIGATDGGIDFNPKMQINRAGLLLHKDVVFIAFACHCDRQPYYGWVIAYEAKDPGANTFLQQIGAKNLNPTTKNDDTGAGIWMQGFGLACDDSSKIYFATGNGLFVENQHYGDSVIKLQYVWGQSFMSVEDYFTPSNQKYLSDNDYDLGSGGVMVIPDQANRRLAIFCGKERVIYLINRNQDSMGKYAGISHSVIMVERAIGAPTLARDGKNNILTIAWTDKNNNVNLAPNADVASNGNLLTGKIPVNNAKSIDGPGFVFDDTGIIYLAWADSQRNIHLISAPDMASINTSPNVLSLSEKSSFKPSLAFANGRLYLAWTGIDTSQSINIMSSADGKNFDKKITLSESASVAPTFSFTNGTLFLLWTGWGVTDPDQHINILELTDDGKSQFNKVTLKDQSPFPPAIVSHNMLLYIVWRGKDAGNSLNLDTTDKQYTIDTFGKGNKVTFSQSSKNGPTLANFDSLVYLSWTGEDNSIIIATLSADKVVQRLPDALGDYSPSGSTFPGCPAYYRGPNEDGQISEFVYYCEHNDNVKAFELVGESLYPSFLISGQRNQSKEKIPGDKSGATPSVSSNLDNANTGIVWILTHGPDKVGLRAYKATNLNYELGEWDVGSDAKFTVPTVINGKVYATSRNQLSVFGLK